ncbi:zinc finger protein 92 homolog isoform X3 [Pantherophis guttatus]|uniref:Zinc finger protein 92 homolog isoform X3 n=1 Tax=Pantherophis guttatus TaxID=94885 RepID=A0ABM3YZM3_PANGU|nr:zinc finger protein 92 homolog isoform X3 [Pantherophis guttatus]
MIQTASSLPVLFPEVEASCPFSSTSSAFSFGGSAPRSPFANRQHPERDQSVSFFLQQARWLLLEECRIRVGCPFYTEGAGPEEDGGARRRKEGSVAREEEESGPRRAALPGDGGERPGGSGAAGGMSPGGAWERRLPGGRCGKEEMGGDPETGLEGGGFFGSPRKLRRIQEEAKEYQCPECETFFTRNGHLQRHISIHTGEKKYEFDFDSHPSAQAGNPLPFQTNGCPISFEKTLVIEHNNFSRQAVPLLNFSHCQEISPEFQATCLPGYFPSIISCLPFWCFGK